MAVHAFRLGGLADDLSVEDGGSEVPAICCPVIVASLAPSSSILVWVLPLRLSPTV